MSKNTTKNISEIIICPRCKEQFEWQYESRPSLGWVCKYCREELDAPGQFSHFASHPLNDMQERKLGEDWDCDSDSGELPELEPPCPDLAPEEIFEGF